MSRKEDLEEIRIVYYFLIAYFIFWVVTSIVFRFVVLRLISLLSKALSRTSIGPDRKER